MSLALLDGGAASRIQGRKIAMSEKKTAAPVGLASTMVRLDELVAHMNQVHARYATIKRQGMGPLQARVDQIEAKTDRVAREQMLREAVNAPTAEQKIHWLRKEADTVVEAARGVAPCGAGCSSCCRLNVMVGAAEAVEIGRAIGRTPAVVAAERRVRAADLLGGGQRQQEAEQALAQLETRYFGKACAFLGSTGGCSIYEARPMACRWLVSVDDDALLCRLVPTQSVQVPYLDTRRQKLAYLRAMGLHEDVADLREWFPG